MKAGAKQEAVEHRLGQDDSLLGLLELYPDAMLDALISRQQ
jgi:hypothetical protein